VSAAAWLNTHLLKVDQQVPEELAVVGTAPASGGIEPLKYFTECRNGRVANRTNREPVSNPAR